MLVIIKLSIINLIIWERRIQNTSSLEPAWEKKQHKKEQTEANSESPTDNL